MLWIKIRGSKKVFRRRGDKKKKDNGKKWKEQKRELKI